MRYVVPVSTHRGDHGYLVHDQDGQLEGFVRLDVMMPPLGHVIGRHVLLHAVTVPVPEMIRFGRMPGVTHA